MPLTPEQIMRLWEQDHQPLTREHRQQFLRRYEVRELSMLPPAVVKAAIRRSPRLADILDDARNQSASSGTSKRSTAEVHPGRKPRGQTPAKPAPRKPLGKKVTPSSAARKQRDRDRDARQRNGTDYVGSSTLRRAGRPERDLREKCSSCGALVDPASAHDC